MTSHSVKFIGKECKVYESDTKCNNKIAERLCAVKFV